MPTAHKNRWELSMKADLQSILIPEPQHRVGPVGVSSGISVRKLPMPCTEQIRLICMHYVNKCSGKYADNKLAARYVHQMADEVLSQLSGVSAEIDVVGANVELMKQRIKEWEDNFPATLTDIGHPKAIADLINKQKKKIADLVGKLEAEKKTHDKDVNDVLRSMNVQLQAARNSTFLERQQLSLAHQQDEEQHKQRMAVSDHEHHRTIEALKREHRQELIRLRQSLQIQYDESTASLKQEATARVKGVKDVYDKEMSKLKNRYVQDIGVMEDHVQLLEERLVKLHIDLNGEENIDELEIPSYELPPLRVSALNLNMSSFNSFNNQDGGRSIGSWGGSEEEESDEVVMPQSPRQSAREIISRIGTLNVGSPLIKAKHSSGGHELSDIKRDNRVLRTKLTELGKDYKTLQSTISVLSEERQGFDNIISDWKKNHEQTLKKISQLEEINEQLRNALAATCESQQSPTCHVWAQVRPLQHTADFLQRADARGLK